MNQEYYGLWAGNLSDEPHTLEERYAAIQARIDLTKEGDSLSADRLTALKALPADTQWLLDHAKEVADIALGRRGNTTLEMRSGSRWGSQGTFVRSDDVLDALGEPPAPEVVYASTRG